MTVDFEYDMDIDGRELKVFVEADGYCYTDNNYGADIDGNRGVKRDFVENTTITVTDARGNVLTGKILDKHRYEYDRILETAEEKIHEAYYEERMGW